MSDVNWWLMALAFLLGLLLTFAMMIRRVTREVPVTLSASAGVGGGPDVGLKGPDLGKIAGAVSAAGAGAAATLSGAADKAGEKVGAAADAVGDAIGSILEREPHGAGSIRLAARRDAPPGYLVKFDAESQQYFVPGAPGYEELETEWWFVDEESAKAAGFSRWDEIKAKVGDLVERAGDKVGDAKDALADKIGEAADKIGEAKDALGDAADSVGGKIGAAATAAAGLMSIDDVPAGPYGKGSAKAGDDGSGPSGWLIKGNADSMLYHPPDSPAYEQTIAEVWFFDEETARAAGFDKWDKNFR